MVTKGQAPQNSIHSPKQNKTKQNKTNERKRKGKKIFFFLNAIFTPTFKQCNVSITCQSIRMEHRNK